MIRKVACFLLLLVNYTVAISQVEQVEFGKNRIQYHDDFDQWLFYEAKTLSPTGMGKLEITVYQR